ncbi:MAG: hypothetical protein WC371_02755 [Parachlamydiales bacterium]|jgi:uncharacterized phage infection (PIP) family protein YhgE
MSSFRPGVIGAGVNSAADWAIELSLPEAADGQGEKHPESASSWYGHSVTFCRYCLKNLPEMVTATIALSGFGVAAYGLAVSANIFTIAGGISFLGGGILALVIKNLKIKKSFDELIRENKETNERYRRLVEEMGKLTEKLQKNVDTFQTQNNILAEASSKIIKKLNATGSLLQDEVTEMIGSLKKIQDRFNQGEELLKIIQETSSTMKGLTAQCSDLLSQIKKEKEQQQKLVQRIEFLEAQCRKWMDQAEVAAQREEVAERAQIALRNQMQEILGKMNRLIESIRPDDETTPAPLKDLKNQLAQEITGILKKIPEIRIR